MNALTTVNQVYTYPGQPQMQVEVILASRNATMPSEKPLYTVRLRYPRIIHSEIMTHRDFSRNARSSRAVPVRTMLDEVRNTPFVPWHWGKNQKGMQAGEECNEEVYLSDAVGVDGHEDFLSREEAWKRAAECAAEVAEGYMDAGYHKQVVNRLLEPFAWIDVLITSNRWANFLWLRDHKDAEPHLQDLARLVKVALEEAHVQDLGWEDWHLPYITDNDIEHVMNLFSEGPVEKFLAKQDEWLCKISAARCARISYKPFDGDASYERELERYDGLVKSDRVHASPLEHQATPDTQFLGSLDVFYEDNETCLPDETRDADMMWSHPELHGNLPGWVQFRKTIPNECRHD